MGTRTNLMMVGMGILMLALPAFAQWSPPQPVSQANSTVEEKSPFLSFDGLTLYFSRQGGSDSYYTRIYQATRTLAGGTFDTVSEISALNYTGGHVDSPWVSSDNLRMYYYRTEPGSLSRIKLSQRTSASAPWTEGSNVDELNALGRVAQPTLSSNELTVVFTGNGLIGGVGGYDLWMATRTAVGLAFTNIVNLTAVNSTASDYQASLSADGLALYFVSNRYGSDQLFRASRTSPGGAFGAPELVTTFDMSGSTPGYPFLSSDGKSFYLTLDNGTGRDLYLSTYGQVEPNDVDDVTGDYYVNAATGNDYYNGRTSITPFATIQKALNTAVTGQVVVVAAGQYRGTNNKNLTFAGRGITLRSAAGPETTIIDCEGIGQGFLFQSGEQATTVVNGFTILNGNSQNGGGIYCRGASPRIVNCIVTHNQGYNCGGVYATNYGSPTFSNCRIIGNTGTLGGGVRFAQSGGTLTHCVIAGNTSTSAGAGIKCDNGSTSTVIGFCTVVNNVSGTYGGGLWATYARPTVRNSIFWNNQGTSTVGKEMAIGNSAVLTVGYSDVKGGQSAVYRSGGTLSWSSGNLNTDPLFVDPNGDYHLQSQRGRYWPEYDLFVLDAATSPCIDAGDPTEAVLDEPYPNGTRVNMGAYGATAYASLSLDCTGGGQSLPGDANGDGYIDITDLFVLIDTWLSQYGSAMTGDI